MAEFKEWMNEWINEWMNDWLNEWLIDWMKKNPNEWIKTVKRKNGCNKEQTSWISLGNLWINKWMNEWMNDWLNEWIKEWMINWMKKKTQMKEQKKCREKSYELSGGASFGYFRKFNELIANRGYCRVLPPN